MGSDQMLVYMLTISYSLVVWAVCTSFYSKINLSLMFSMHMMHWAAFKSHIKSMLIVYVATMLSFGFNVGYCVYNFYSVVCAYGLTHKHFITPFFDILKPNKGICSFFLNHDAQQISTEVHFGNTYLTTDFGLLLPVVLFILLDRPHDCFACLGKDPVRPYSIYQLKRKEVVDRQMVA